MSWTWAGFLVAILVGLFLAAAPFWARFSWLRKPAHLESKRFGIDLTADSRTLIVFFGALLVLGGGHALYRADREDLHAAQTRAEEARRGYLDAEAKLLRFLTEGAKYPLELVPVFDEVSQADLEDNQDFYFRAQVEIEVSPSGGNTVVLAGDALVTGQNDYGIQVRRNKSGLLIEGQMGDRDAMTLIVRDGENVWRGDYDPPKVQLPLTLVQTSEPARGG